MIRMIETGDEVMLNRNQAAAILGVRPHTLACWRSEGRGPACVKYGAGRSAAVRYRRSDVLRFAADPVAAEAESGEPWREARRRAAAESAAARAKAEAASAKAKAPQAGRRRRRSRACA
jgi:hypothetical protein